MQNRLHALRLKWEKQGKPQLGVRIGLNTGIMIVGNMGGQERFDYTVIGDSMNLASRLEGANKQYRSHIMISEFTYNKVKDKFLVRELDLIQVKGKNVPVKVFEVLARQRWNIPKRKSNRWSYITRDSNFTANANGTKPLRICSRRCNIPNENLENGTFACGNGRPSR